MSTCAACRFWNRNGDPLESTVVDESSEWSDYLPTRKKKCLNVLHSNYSSETASAAFTAPAVVTDGSGYAATFWTEPTFGCTSFTPVEPTPIRSAPNDNSPASRS